MDRVDHWTRQIERIMEDKKKNSSAWCFLESVKKEINLQKRITDGQIEAIKHIQYGKYQIGDD